VAAVLGPGAEKARVAPQPASSIEMSVRHTSNAVLCNLRIVEIFLFKESSLFRFYLSELNVFWIILLPEKPVNRRAGQQVYCA